STVNLKEAEAQAAADLEEAEAQLAAVTGRVEELRAMVAGLRLAIKRYGLAGQSPLAQAHADAEARARAADEAAMQVAEAEEKRLHQIRIAEVATRFASREMASAGKGTQADLVRFVLERAGRPLSTLEVREAVNARS